MSERPSKRLRHLSEAEEDDVATNLVQQNRIAELNMQMRLPQNDTILQEQQSRPKGTKSGYIPKQREFSQWCTKLGFPDNETVNSDKLHFFNKGGSWEGS